jgi:hypothetical protein
MWAIDLLDHAISTAKVWWADLASLKREKDAQRLYSTAAMKTTVQEPAVRR